MFTGIVHYYNTNKGYGTIRLEDSEGLLFFHKDNAKALLKTGDKVKFEFEHGKVFKIIKRQS